MTLMGPSYLFYNSPQKMEHSNNNIPEVFLFVNSTSGGGIGRELLDLNVAPFSFRSNNSTYKFQPPNTQSTVTTKLKSPSISSI
jgi:hypothetical protein